MAESHKGGLEPEQERLYLEERQRLSVLEGVIEQGLSAFVEVGEALLEIRNSRLYRESHYTFGDYCRERWELDKPYAHRLIVAAEVTAKVTAMVPTGTTAPANEAQPRELAPLRREPIKLAEAWTEATERAEAEERSVTARDVREVVESRKPERKKVEYELCPTCGRGLWVRADRPLRPAGPTDWQIIEALRKNGHPEVAETLVDKLLAEGLESMEES